MYVLSWLNLLRVFCCNRNGDVCIRKSCVISIDVEKNTTPDDIQI